MSNFNTDKIDGVSFLNAEEWNQIQDLENLITSSGQTPNTSLINQIPQAVANYVAIADSYTDSGTANNYILTSINTFKSPTAYVDGMRVRFITANANTGASTVNVANLGTKNIKKEDGTTDLTANDIPANNEITLIYRNGVFKIAGLSSVQNTSSTTKGIVYYSQPITISNNTIDSNNDIDFSAGNFIFNDFSGEATTIAMTKKLQSSGSWSAGTNGNMLLSGAKEANSTYHLFAIYNPTTNTSDFAAIKGVANTDPNPTAFLPSGYTKWKRVGSIITNASGNIIFFIQDQNKFILPLKKDVDSIGTTSASLFTLTAPLGISTEAIIDYYIFSSAPIHYGLITSPYQLDQAPTSDLFNIYVHGSVNITSEKRTYIKTDKSSRIRTRFTGSTDISQRIFTSGWIDNLI